MPELTSEAWAAILGGFVGSVGAFSAQWSLSALGRRRTRRAAAQVVFGELTVGFAEAKTALVLGKWPNPLNRAYRSAWETHSTHLLSWRTGKRAAHIASAYSALDNLAWLASGGHLKPEDDHSTSTLDVRLGLYEVGRLAGFSDVELENRGVLDDELKQERSKLHALHAASRKKLSQDGS